MASPFHRLEDSHSVSDIIQRLLGSEHALYLLGWIGQERIVGLHPFNFQMAKFNAAAKPKALVCDQKTRGLSD